MHTIAQTDTWKTLSDHANALAPRHLRDLFHHHPHRFDEFSVECGDLFLDFTKQRLTNETLSLLLQLTEDIQLQSQINSMFSGKTINFTENRAVLHTALRSQQKPFHQATPLDSAIQHTLTKMQGISEKIRTNAWHGFSGKPITDIVNIGIGGSDLGPKMVLEALSHLTSDQLRCHFVSNVDGTGIQSIFNTCQPDTTLFIVSSKSFTTPETRLNAETAKAWILKHADEKAIEKHFIAITSQQEKALAFGIPYDHILALWDAIGGRYSVWSAIGLPIAILCGMQVFESFLEGAYTLDEHFKTAEYSQNLPVLLGLIDCWNRNFLHIPSKAILPYANALRFFPEYLQQLEMESNGKQVNAKNTPLTHYQTSPIIWGTVGTNGQHSFHQCLHQGTDIVSTDFILPITLPNTLDEHHRMLAANCFAQSQTLMQGKTLEQAHQECLDNGMTEALARELAPHKVLPGNRPSNTLLLASLTPHALGMLIALYEHKVFVQGALWQINSFDQWGVELGKVIANAIYDDLTAPQASFMYDVSTNGLMKRFCKK